MTLTLPRLGMQMEEATVVRFCVEPGGAFDAGTPLYEIETEKVTNEIEATVDGTMVEYLVEEGDDVEVGEAVCIIETP